MNLIHFCSSMFVASGSSCLVGEANVQVLLLNLGVKDLLALCSVEFSRVGRLC